jgi:UDP-N-acetylglucosamine 2-epimerase (non-hydrolysing)
MHITIIAGTRPNFIKVGPIIHAINRAKEDNNISYRLVHTGQHYDKQMSDSFFIDLKIPHPDVNLSCGGGTQAEQTAAIMIAFEKELTENPCDFVLVVGDVTSTMACTIVAKKMNTKVIHVESGIRSFDMSMPEEINRLVTDSLTDVFFTTSEFANTNLRNEGVPDHKVHFVGNVMIDSLIDNIDNFTKPQLVTENNLLEKAYFVLTLHRPSNVDNPENLRNLLTTILQNVGNNKVLFPIHPRTLKVFNTLNLHFDNLIIVEPLGYLEFNWLVKNAKGVITDSGGITEETTVMGVPCMTLRENTERPETCSVGTNELVGLNTTDIINALDKIVSGNWKKGAIPEKWDGKTSDRIVKILLENY